MSYLGYDAMSNCYLFTNGVITLEIKADSEIIAIERARQYFFGMA